jgi:Ca-activated chloride channel family protein
VATAEDHQSTFGLDVDTGSYTVARSYLTDGRLPDPAAVRTEEFINFFRQDYQPPADGIGIHLDGTAAPFLPDPGKRVLRVGLPAAVLEAADRPPANLTLVVDTSGSMAGLGLEMVQAGLSRLVDSLRPDDRVAIVSYSDDAALRLPMTPRSEEAAIRRVIGELSPQASTNLEAGLRVGYQQARANLRTDGINRVILLLDGAANVGQTDPGALAGQIAREAGHDTQLVVVGVGRRTYNEVILEQFADRGNGFYAYIDTIREAERRFVHDLTGTLQVVALDAKVQVSFNPAAVSHYRLLGYENRQLADDDLRDDAVDGGEIGAGHTVTAIYEITLAGGGDTGPTAALATVQVRWTDPGLGGPVERSAAITAGDLVGSLPLAPPRLQQDLLVAESLRGAPWSERVSRDEIAEAAELLSLALPDDPDLAELAQLTRIAAGDSP